ncbi:hypothetical protein ABES13_27775 [Bacillus pseudomycoides]|jgi:hypothetical protein|uniref:hypothetical protein n=1 Tax=Bacillus pseudomycoides TaxID=64104 RepID=UPI000BEBE1D6|nr:hypothetical protein [Bacillus pseudomycoides]PEE04987.1 hypothetical protein CON86_17110 [Bacillus pseudomycoides]PEM78533.1 hypothetical protein CN632_07180 [Bacillus pseudomycoides]PHC85234.1 hypothetical protein COF63_14130 [Bacillus pseudomycoides]
MLVKAKELQVEKQNTLVTTLGSNPAYGLLVAEIKRHQTIEGIKSTDAFEIIFGGKEYEAAADAVFVTLADEAIVQALQYGTDVVQVKAIFTAEENGKKVIHHAIVQDGKVIVEQVVAHDPQHFAFIEELKTQKGAEESSNEIKEEAWYDGCLVFYNSGNGKYYYYNHCGKGCGGESKPVINTLDSCCRTHDRCYNNFGFNDCGCDADLSRCANAASDPGWWMVSEWARIKSCN